MNTVYIVHRSKLGRGAVWWLCAPGVSLYSPAYMADCGHTGILAPGKNADLLADDGDPLADAACLLDSERRLRCAAFGGRPAVPQDRVVDAGRICDFSLQWNDLYTRDRFAKLRAEQRIDHEQRAVIAP